MRHRRGVSLVELILTMSACCVILTMSAALIHRALHVQSRSRSFVEGERSATRLAEAFRRDVQAAQSAELPSAAAAEGVFLRLALPGGQTIDYRQSDGAVQRIGSGAGAVQSREAFPFDQGTEVRAEKIGPQTIALSLAPATESARAPDRPLNAYAAPTWLRVQASLGRNASLADVAPRQENSP